MHAELPPASEGLFQGRFLRNDDLLSFACEVMVARVRQKTGRLPVIAFFPAVDENIAEKLAKHEDWGDLQVCPLDFSGPHQSAGGPSWPTIGEERPIIVVLRCAFYGLDRSRAANLLAQLPAELDAIVIVDQIDNCDGQGSETFTLKDSDGREYEAECHDLRALLDEIGINTLVPLAFPLPSKSISGAVVAERSPGDDAAAHEESLVRALNDAYVDRQRFDIRRYRGQMVGQFMVPSCAPAGLRMKALIQNTVRTGEAFPVELRKQGVMVDLRVFQNGVLRHHDPTFARITLGGVQEISEATCPALSGDQSGLLVVVRCSLPSDGPTYFAQEHQIFYENARTGSFSSLLYDQIPVMPDSRPHSPIVLIAPKVWVSKNLSSYVAFASTNSTTIPNEQSRPIVVTVLDQNGSEIYKKQYEVAANTTFLFDVKAAVNDRLMLTDTSTFLTVVAKGGAGSFAIVTFVVNDETGNFTLEHSLSPHYYVSGNLARIREDALQLSQLEGQ